MAQCKQNPQEFIKNAFIPQIGVIYTPLAESICQKNNLNFVELLQPFSKLTMDLQYKDPTGNNVILKSFKLSFSDIKSRPPQPAIARKMLNSSVTDAPEPKFHQCRIGDTVIDRPMQTPWFEAWRDAFLKVQYPSDHEFTKHFLGCWLIVSSSDNNPVETMIQLAQHLNHIQNTSPDKLPKWFSLNVLKYYVILHDTVEGNSVVAAESYESLKSSYGAISCFLLKINSRPLGVSSNEHLADPWNQFLNGQISLKSGDYTPDASPNLNRHSELEIGQEPSESKNINYHPLSPDTDEVELYSEKNQPTTKNPGKYVTHGSCLTVDDIENVKALVYEFSRFCLLPYIEKQMASLNETVANKKGMSKSLFSATKRWFSPNKPGASAVAVNHLLYSPDSAELQIRRLGDLYFMFGNYLAAFHAYHLAKRDYNTDQAWLYYAGSLEMAALSAFMANESSRKTYDYMEESITTYLNTCKMPQFATRATVLSCECLKSNQMYGEAAHQLIRMTSEESDLRSALLLEQAAYCFLMSKMIRKYAFHMVLAGHRFSKAAQRKHSLRCYKQAYQIYSQTTWDLASDHIHYTIGRQANNLQYYNEAVEYFLKLLKGESKQTTQQQAIFLKEYLTILDNKLKKDNDAPGLLPVLPVPELNHSLLKVLVGPTRPLSTPSKVAAVGINFNTSLDPTVESKWNKLEELLVSEREGSLPLLFKPIITLHNLNTLTKTKPFAIVNEPIQVSIEMVNLLQTVLHLKEVYLLWTLKDGDRVITNETPSTSLDEYVKTFVTKTVILQGSSKQDLILTVTPLVTGDLSLTGICYILSGCTSNDTIFIKEKKLFDISSGNSDVTPILITIVPSAPCLQVTFTEIHSDFIVGELQRVTIDFQNTGAVPLENIYMATSVPHLMANCTSKSSSKLISSSDSESQLGKDKLTRKNHITFVELPRGKLESRQSYSMSIWLKAPEKKGPAIIELLIYYESLDKKCIPRYRLIRHSWSLIVHESVSSEVSFRNSFNSKLTEEMMVSVKTTNLNKIHSALSTEITLVNIALLSQKWALMKDISVPSHINLQCNQSAHFFLKAKRSISKCCRYSCIPLNSHGTLQVPTDAYMVFAEKYLNSAPNVFENHESDCDNKEGVLLLQWQAIVNVNRAERTVQGQCYIPLDIRRENEDEIRIDRLIGENYISINDRTSLADTTFERAQKQVFYNLMHSPIIEHNFRKVALCVVPMKLFLHSVVEESSVTVTVNTVDSSTKNEKFNYRASEKFCWLGNVKIVKILAPLSTDSVELSVGITQPGTYDLSSHIQIMCSGESDEIVVQSCQIHSSLIVHSSLS